jgi:hypothetical protein
MANGLKKFVDDLKGEPPRTVSALKLDENFARCAPAERGLLSAMGLNFTHEGWYLDLRPPGNGTYVLGAVNGQVQWIATEDCGNGDD